MKGIAFLTVKVWFETDLTDEEIDEVVQEVDYEFNHKLIAQTEIIEIQQL